jgi:hypothetical protein
MDRGPVFGPEPRHPAATKALRNYTGFVREEISRMISDSADMEAELGEALITSEERIMP